MRIEDIENPTFLKNLSYKELDELANDIRKYILETVSENGGHLSSNLGVVELTIALHRVFNAPFDKILFDVGHQTYTHKILTGRANEFKNLRKLNGISGYQKLNESIYDAMEAGHSSTSISIASGMAYARDLNNEKYDIVAVCGDASIVSGLSLEALNCLGNQKSKVIIIFNDNEMAISKPTGGINLMLNNIRGSSKYQNNKSGLKKVLNKNKFLKFFYNFFKKIKNIIKSLFYQSNIFEDFSLEYLGPYDGHNIKELEKAFNSAKNMKESVVIHVKTIKGKGYKLAEEDKDGHWHGINPFNLENGKVIKKIDDCYLSWSECISEHLYNEMLNNKNIVTLTPAMITGSKLENIFKDFNDRSIDLGINEEHATTFLSGLALNKKIPVLSIYSTFMQRSYDNLNHDLARMNLAATILVDRAGLVGEDGDTHNGIYDVEITKGLRNSVIAMPLNYNDAKNILNLAINSNKLFFIRYPKEFVLKSNFNYSSEIKIGKWDILNNGNDEIVIISTGPISVEIEKIIKNKYSNITLIFARFYKPIDELLLKNIFLKTKKLIIYDIYATKNALYTDICTFIAENNFNINIKGFTLPNKEISQGNINELLIKLNLSLKDLEKEIINYEIR